MKISNYFKKKGRISLKKRKYILHRIFILLMQFALENDQEDLKINFTQTTKEMFIILYD